MNSFPDLWRPWPVHLFFWSLNYHSPFCNICSFHTLFLAIAQRSHIFPSAWKATYVMNSDSFLKSRHGLLLKSHALQQIIFAFQAYLRHHSVMVPWNLVPTPGIESSPGLVSPALSPGLRASLCATWKQEVLVLTPLPGIMFGTW